MRPRQALERLLGALRGRTARAGSWALVGQGGAMVASLANFLLLARLIGPADYGQVAAAWALVLTLGPVLTLGADRLVVRDVSANRQEPAIALTAALLTVLAGSAAAVVVVSVLHPLLLPDVPFLLVAALAVSDITGVAVFGCVYALCFATGSPRASAVLAVSVSGAKVAAVVVFALVDGQDPVVWALLYASATTLLVALQLAWAFRRFGRPRPAGYRLLPRAREGLAYSGNQAASMIQNDSDKIVLVRSGYAAEAGLYSVAYRLATTAYLPVLAVVQSTFPRFFAVGAEGGVTATAAFARRLAPPLVAYGIVAAAALALASPLVPVLVGEEYRGSVPLLMVLCVLPLLRVGQVLTGDALTGSGRQRTRTACFVGSAGLNLTLNLIFTPTYGLQAALAATLVAELVALALLALAVRRHKAAEAAAQQSEVAAA